MKVRPIGFVALAAALLLVLAAACASDESSGTTAGGSTGDARPDAGAAPSVGEEAPSVQGAGETSDAGQDGAAAPDPALQGLLDRKIIQNTTVDLEVDEVGRSFQDIIGIAQGAGGLVASSSFSNLDDEQVADLTIRVPADRHQDVLARLRDLGTVMEERSDANDITEEYTDLQARLRTLQATEQRYLELLGRAQSIEDILLVQDRLDGVRGQIEQVQGRINMLDQLTDLGTITIHLRPAAGGDGAGGAGPSPVRAARAAWDSSLIWLRALATAGVAVAVFSWWMVFPLLVVAGVARWWAGRGPASSAGPAP